ncbi:PQQ-binding-like beta-propeller repeat protein [Alteriqipengyuania sp. WL0013]|uniref:outer membrane protein assembly factor BamB family protein n=1 Tax=Alteriqipengyuania sp. WL0013 TaxID=3110773 RepID=UPI002B58AC5D|nr:PQQ-binding-like beta-propeller repeat protein [Alteriqipengyuania sp. WL0013]MEB3415506.1 PQQ-binding-like beta-propeller repeat protein [Alteriqipengyuania sp. WL0013]
MTRTKPFSFLAVSAMALAVSGCGIFGGSDDKTTTPTVGNRVPILSQIRAGAVVDPSLAGVSVIVPAAQANADWPQPGGAASNAIGHVALGATPALAWTAQIEGSNDRRRLGSSPVVGGGKLFVVDTSGTIRAFDAASGGALWTKALERPDGSQNAAFGGGVSYAGGQLFATDGTGNVVAMSADTGEIRWQVKPAGPLRNAPTVAFNQVFVMTQDNQIHALSTLDGSAIWSDTAAAGTAGVFGVGAPAAAQGSVIAGYSSGELTAYRYENGRNLWSDALARTSISTQVGTLTDVDAGPIIESGKVYALGQGGRMAAYDLLSGQRQWELNIAGISTPAVAGEWLFVLTDEAELLSIQRTTGKVRWISQLDRYRDAKDREGEIFWTGPVLAGNSLWVASSRGAVKRVDVMSGAIADFQQLNSGVSLPPIVAGGTMYILEDNGRINAYR